MVYYIPLFMLKRKLFQRLWAVIVVIMIVAMILFTVVPYLF